MYNTEGIHTIATITELRSDTSDLINYVRDNKEGILIQKNNEPYAVLLDWETFREASDQFQLSNHEQNSS